MIKVGRFAGHTQAPQHFFNIPLAYNGRASSVVCSGQEFVRPYGMVPSPDGVQYSPCQRLDYEAELGIFISNPVEYGETVSASKAGDHIFGFVLVNDWSARDIQFYEMMPLGPFNGKSTATSISPWIVTLDALRDAGAQVPFDAVSLESSLGGKATSHPFLRCPVDISIRVSSYISSE